MAAVRDVYEYLDRRAPFALQMEFDNSGFLVGRGEAEVRNILVALDITEEVVAEAAEQDCQLIVSHHPILFHPARHVTDASPNGRILLALTENRIAAICAHTNLDAVSGGVNDALGAALGLEKMEQLHQDGVDPSGRPYGVGRIGEVTGYPDARSFAAFVRDALKVPSVRLEDAGRPVRRVAVGGGSCGSMLADVAAKGCDTFVTADVKHDVFLEAAALGVNLIDAGHFSTENVVCPVLAGWLREEFPQMGVFLSRRQKEVFSCL